MGIGKSLRFQIFARDGFVCQYCGQRPPDVVLELDHIHPRSKGGDDDPINLVTSCWDCNRGKRDKILADVPRRPDADIRFLEAQQEIAEADRYILAKNERDAAFNRLCALFEDIWAEKLDEPSIPSRNTLGMWLRRYGPEELETAIEIVSPKFTALGFHRRTNQQVHKYISGILRKRAGEKEDAEG